MTEWNAWVGSPSLQPAPEPLALTPWTWPQNVCALSAPGTWKPRVVSNSSNEGEARWCASCCSSWEMAGRDLWLLWSTTIPGYLHMYKRISKVPSFSLCKAVRSSVLPGLVLFRQHRECQHVQGQLTLAYEASSARHAASHIYMGRHIPWIQVLGAECSCAVNPAQRLAGFFFSVNLPIILWSWS